MHLLNIFILAATAVSAAGLEERDCSSNNCVRAVQGTVRGTAQVSIARADCSSFLDVTVTVPPSAATVAPRAVSSKVVPQYATACSGAARYSSACSCWGVTATTVTVTSGVASSSSTASTSSTSSVIPGPTFTPVIVTDYKGCFLDPSSANEFDLLPINSNGLPVINNNGIASIPTTDPGTVPQFHFSKPVAAPVGLYDAVLTSGATSLFLAVYSSGKVGFVSSSTNGQTWTAGPGGEKYITTIFNVACNGEVSAGVINGPQFNFVIVNNNVVVDNIPSGTVIRRDIEVPKGFLVLPKAATPVVSKLRCPNPGQFAVSKIPPVTPSSNGCGAASGASQYAPNFDFKPCCDGHDVCYGTCDQSFDGCNSVFLTCNLNRCDTLYGPGIKHYACTNAAKFYGWAVTTDTAAGAFTDATKEACDCKCTDTTKTVCNEQCVDLKADPENCGECFFHCPTGKCTNGACAFNACLNLGTCNAFSTCSSGGSCVCASISDNTGFCVNGDTPCDGLADCGTSADCGLGSVCAVGSCCERNVCITTDACGGKNNPRLLKGRMSLNATIGHQAGWLSEGMMV